MMALRRRRRFTTGAVVVAIVALTALLPTEVARGHVPALESRAATGAATPVGGPDISRALYGYLAPGEGQDTYTFTVAEPVTTTVAILVPALAEHVGFNPTAIITAEEGPPVVLTTPLDGAAEWEPFSLTSFRTTAEEEVTFEPGRRYVLRVEPTNGSRSGRYVLVFGGAERFTGPDTLRTLRDLPVIWFGAYGGAPFSMNWWALIPVGIMAGLVVAAGWLIVRAVRSARR